MANKMTDASEKKTVPVNILLTEDANLALSALALQTSTAAAGAPTDGKEWAMVSAKSAATSRWVNCASRSTRW